MKDKPRASADDQLVAEAKKAALEVLLHNVSGPYQGLPRTAGWGYPEPYTRDLMFSILGTAVTRNAVLIESSRRVLQTLAMNQTEKGHITSLVSDKDDRGASDTTPLFLIGVAIFRIIVNEPEFLKEAVKKALTWLEYQSPSDEYLVAQQPTSDWRDEQWIFGYGLFVNALVYISLKLLNKEHRARQMHREMELFTISGNVMPHHVHEGLAMSGKPYFASWSYKIYNSDRFDLLGNSLAILSGIASPEKAIAIINWVEKECSKMKSNGELALNIPPNFFPFIKAGDQDWHLRYELYNMPGDYHNGGIWPFVCAFYIAALVAGKKFDLAHNKLLELTHCVKLSASGDLKFGFNEWHKAQDGKPMGQDWQSWSAALYLYAAKCVELKKTPFFDDIRKNPSNAI